MKTALLFGASGQIGKPLRQRLLAAGWQVLAISRNAPPAPHPPGLLWLAGSLEAMPELPATPALILSAGPLDAFARWHDSHDAGARRVIAFGSTSVKVKADSADPGERDVARRLQRAETALAHRCAQRGSALTVLRPTLIYGHGSDRSLSRIVQLARRHGRFFLPRTARGLRQPVHADDLADAAIAAIHRPESHGQSYDLPGGETLDYTQMVARVLATLDPPAQLHRLPMPLFSAALALARARGKLAGFNPAMLARMQQDLTFDLHPARRDLGYTPRPFRPEAGMFGEGGAG